jgi:DNA topoisomerase-1
MKQARFTTLFSLGPLFPEKYQVKGYKLAGEKLPVLAEEMLWTAASRLYGNDYEKEAFVPNGNMWKNLKPQLTLNQQKLQFPVDFIPLVQTMKKEQESIKLAKKQESKEEKLLKKAEKEKLKEKYGFADVDGQRIQLGNYQVEAPAWIVTRGKHPGKFNWKYAVQPEDVELNIVNCQPPKNWKGGTYSDNTSQFVARYKVKCGIEGDGTYRELHKAIPFVSWSPMRLKTSEKKFDKTADILKNWKKIQKHIYEGCISGNESALVAYLIQQTGIRIGNARDLQKQADTRGASTLRKNDITFL